MENKLFFEMHRSEAIKILLTKENYPSQYTNLRLAELLEEYFPEKERSYIIIEDIHTLNNNFLTAISF